MAHFKSCSRCGKIHDTKYKCTKGIVYRGGEERKLRSSYAWRQKSIEIRKRASYLCEVCKDNGLYSYSGVEVHHIDKVKDNPSLLLDNYNLICLCKYHHEQADEGFIDKEYLKELARKREE